jgi:hypothetical protein
MNNKESPEAVQAAQKIDQWRQIVERISSLETRQSGMNGLRKAVSNPEGYFNTNHLQHTATRNALRRAENCRPTHAIYVFTCKGYDKWVAETKFSMLIV